METLVNKLSEQFKSYSSVSFSEAEGYDAVINIARYRSGSNEATSAQINFLKSFKNINGLSSSRMFKFLSKAAASALITIAKENRDKSFYVEL